MKMSNFASGDVRDNRKLHLARFWQYYFDCQPLKDYVTLSTPLHSTPYTLQETDKIQILYSKSDEIVKTDSSHTFKSSLSFSGL